MAARKLISCSVTVIRNGRFMVWPISTRDITSLGALVPAHSAVTGNVNNVVLCVNSTNTSRTTGNLGKAISALCTIYRLKQVAECPALRMVGRKIWSQKAV
jgi:hypothetical protein